VKTKATAPNIIEMPRRKGAGKTVAANQKALDALPLGSGTWRIEGVPGLYVRCRAASKSFFVQRKVGGRVVKKTLGELSLREARRRAAWEWSRLAPAPAQGKTLEDAFEEYFTLKDLSPKTQQLYRYNLERYLGPWRGRKLYDIGNDRAGVRRLFQRLSEAHGKAAASQVIRMLSAVYRFARRVDVSLPECPTVAVDLPAIKPRDWAMGPEELREWWKGVQGLTTLKRMWWLTCLLTGGRRGSIEALRWEDVDFDGRLINFSVAKGGRTYSVPACDTLVRLLEEYRDCGEIPPSPWVFPSPARPETHIKDVRDDKRGVKSAHRLRHTYRTVLAQLGCPPDQAKLLLGHALGGVSGGYVTVALVTESLRPWANAVARRYEEILGEELRL